MPTGDGVSRRHSSTTRNRITRLVGAVGVTAKVADRRLQVLNLLLAFLNLLLRRHVAFTCDGRRQPPDHLDSNIGQIDRGARVRPPTVVN